MTPLTANLPEGPPGQILALGIAVVALLAIGFGIVGPTLGWYGARADELSLRRQHAAHIEALEAQLPALRAQVGNLNAVSNDAAILLAGNADPIAGANLQSTLAGLAAQAGASLTSAGALPAQPAGALRRIALEVNISGTWPELTALLGAIDRARPRMIVNDLAITSEVQTEPTGDAPVQASFSVTAFRAGGTP